MLNTVDSPQWLCAGESVTGSSHRRTGLPNQDAVHWHPACPEIGVGPPLMLAVSDGHGSPKNFRSHIGAQKAVEIATKLIWEFFVEGQARVNFSDIKAVKDIAQNLLPQRLVHEWSNTVKEDWDKNPTSNTEWERLIQKEGSGTEKIIKDNPEIAYGATLLAVLVTQSFILYMQLGDGDILCVDSQGRTTRPLGRDPRLIANETTSLCLPNAWNEIQVMLDPLEPYPNEQINTMPTLILVSTDGYANSYPSDEEFRKVGRDYLQMIRSTGFPLVRQQLSTFLEETSAGGSGDDITLGIIRRVEHSDTDETRENMKTTSDQVYQLSHRQNSLMKQTHFSLGVSIVALFLATIATALNVWFWLRISQIENRVLQMEENAQDQQKKTVNETSDTSLQNH